jgi:glycosyltransferase involved in cell wall biosynthesis
MKIVHITAKSKGGAGIAAFRLFQSLQNYKDIEVAFVSLDKTVNYKGVLMNDTFFKYKKPSLIKKIYIKFKHTFFITKSIILRRKLNQLKSNLKYEIVSLPFSHIKLKDHPLVQEADIIHLHWIGDFVDFDHFFNENSKKIVWTFHDMNPFLGVFHYENDHYINYNLIKGLNNEVTTFKNKYVNKSNISGIIYPSKWLLAKENNFLIDKKIAKYLIPYAINLNHYKILDKTPLFSKYQIKPGSLVLLFVADNTQVYRKGVDLLFDALTLITTNITLLTVGSGSVPSFDNHHVINLGKINCEKTMVEIFNLADAFIMPSREDNLPNVMLESLACGVPVITFNNSGAESHVLNHSTGILVNEISSFALKEGIELFIKSHKQFDKIHISNYAKKHFAPENIAKKHIAIYNHVLE